MRRREAAAELPPSFSFLLHILFCDILQNAVLFLHKELDRRKPHILYTEE